MVEKSSARLLRQRSCGTIVAVGLLASVLFLGAVGFWRPAVGIPSALAQEATSSSWSAATSCHAVVLTLEQFLGKVPNPNQTQPNVGADYSGGALSLEGSKPSGTTPSSAAWPYSKRSTNPPCTVTLANGTVLPTLVEIHHIKIATPISLDECGTVFPGQCDATFNACNADLAPNCSSTYPDTMHKVHMEIDMHWNESGIAPTHPTAGSIIDIQGFVFWDDGHVIDAWHSFSGWEVHPLSAWRPSTPDFTMSANPKSLTFQTGSSGASTVKLSSQNGFAGTLSLSVSAPTVVTTSINPASATLTPGTSFSSTLKVSSSTVGSYTVTVTGTNGSISHSVNVGLNVTSPPDFAVSASPSSLSIPLGSSGTSTILLTSLNGFSGNLTLTAAATGSISLDSPTASLSPSAVSLSANGTGTSTLTVSTSLLTTPWTYTVTVTASSGTLSRSTAVTVTVTLL